MIKYRKIYFLLWKHKNAKKNFKILFVKFILKKKWTQKTRKKKPNETIQNKKK